MRRSHRTLPGLATDLRTLSADDMEGRLAGAAGGARARAYVVERAALDAEESGQQGARRFVAMPPVPLEQLALNLNMDMIGRDPHDLLYVAGTHGQPFLKPFIEAVAASANVTLRMGHDNPDETSVEDWTRSSDHDPFCQAGIPCLYFGVEDFGNHHKATDVYETMTHAFYVRAVETMLRAVKEFDTGLAEVEKAKAKMGGGAPLGR